MPKVTLALEVGVLAGGADLAGLDHTETGIEDTAGNGVAALMGLVGYDFHDRAPQNLLGRRNAKLHAYNRHCILTYMMRL